MATSFFNEKNRNIAADLAELIVEANQDMPDWLEDIAKDIARYGVKGGGNRRGGSRFGGSNRFGGRDHRVQYNGGGMNIGNNQRLSGYSLGNKSAFDSNNGSFYGTTNWNGGGSATGGGGGGGSGGAGGAGAVGAVSQPHRSVQNAFGPTNGSGNNASQRQSNSNQKVIFLL